MGNVGNNLAKSSYWNEVEIIRFVIVILRANRQSFMALVNKWKVFTNTYWEPNHNEKGKLTTRRLLSELKGLACTKSPPASSDSYKEAYQSHTKSTQTARVQMSVTGTQLINWKDI